MCAEHLLGLPLKHRMKDIRGLMAELETLLKLDGSRVMTGKFQGKDAKFSMANTSLEIAERSFGGAVYPELLPMSSMAMKYMWITGGIIAHSPDFDYPGITFYKTTDGQPDPTKAGYMVYNLPMYGGLIFGTLGQGDIIFNPVGETKIPRAGDITLLSGKILDAVNAVLRLPDSAPASPSTGDTYFNSGTDTLYVYNGTTWVGVTLT